MTRYSTTMSEILYNIREGYSPKEIKMAIGIASDKRYAGGNMTGAVKAIEKIKKGLSDHPQVAAVLKRQNEDIQEEPASPDEGSMAVQQLEFMMHAIERTKMHIQSGGEFPEWMQNKLSGVHEKLKGLYANIEHGEMKEEVEPIQWPSQPLEEELDLDEMKMDDPKLVKAFDKMKKGDTIKLKTSSTINQGKDFVDYIVKSKNVVNKGRVEKITLVTKGNEKAVKKFLYKRDGKVTFAIGDMGASIDDIKEGTWALPDSPKAKAELKKLMSKPIKLGKEGDDAADKLYALIGDDELFDDLYVAGKKNPNGDARDVLKKHMKRLGIKEEVGLKEAALAIAEKLKVSDGVGAWIKDFQKSDAPQFQGKSEEDRKKMALAAFADAGGKLEETELDEAKSATGYEIFHKDFSSAMQHATAFAKSKGQPIKKDEIDNKVATGPKKPSKGKENSYTLETEKGKRWSVQVYNMGNNFELNMYLTSSHVPEGGMLDEAKEPFAVVDTADGNKVVGTASDEKGAKSIITTSELPPMKIKDKKTLKIVKVKKKQMIGQPIKEEEEPKEPEQSDGAKAVAQGREDKKKTRIAQLQLQIAKAQETINKLNAQEKPSE